MSSVDLVDSPISAPLNLSRATNLEAVTLQVGGSSVAWVVMALQTIESENLQEIELESEDVGPNVEEEFLPEWRDLDRLLVQFLLVQVPNVYFPS